MADNETIADIIAEMRVIRVREFQDYADRIEAAHRLEVATTKESLAVGNSGDCAKLREALGKLRAELWNNTVIAGKRKFELYEIADAALAAPPRNCDRPECKDIQSAMNVYRRECCEDGPLYARKEGAMHEAEWLLAPATEKEGGAK